MITYRHKGPPLVPGKVTCLCPTRGRFSLLQKSISMFILQTYENKELLVLNNHSVPIEPSPELEKHNIRVINYGEVNDMVELHNKALEEVDGEYICIWEDDDIYLPWHLENVKKYPLHLTESLAIKPKSTISFTSDGDKLVGSRGDNYFEASYIVLTEVIRQYGFGLHDDPKLADPRFWHWRWLDKLGGKIIRPKFEDCGYVYVWGRQAVDGVDNYHSSGNVIESYQQNNQDTGEGKMLTPVNITHLFQVVELFNDNSAVDDEGEVDVEAYMKKLRSHQDGTLYQLEDTEETSNASKNINSNSFVLPATIPDHSASKTINVFYHLWTEQEWREVFQHHLSTFTQEFINQMYLWVCVPENSEFTEDDIPSHIPQDKVTIIRGDESRGIRIENEWSTLQVMLAFCNQQTENVPVMFLHSKGAHRYAAGAPEQRQFIRDWSSMMLYFLVEKHKDALFALDRADAVGCNLSYWDWYKAPHFSGNFWMAWSDYIKRLARPSSTQLVDRHKSEYWIGTADNCKLFPLHVSIGAACHNWHYHNPYPREKYEY